MIRTASRSERRPRIGRLHALSEIALVAFLVLAACSDGGSSSASPAPPPTAPPPTGSGQNTAPEITVADTVEISEGQVTVIEALDAADSDLDALTFSITGPDAALFILPDPSPTDSNGDGQVSTTLETAGLDFEAPGDADGDGVYEITLEVSDGTSSASQSVSITVADVSFGQGLNFDDFATGRNQPLQVTQGEGDSAYLIEKSGLVLFDDGASGSRDFADVALDLRDSVSTDGERGLLGLALSPNFASDRSVYVNLTNPAGDTEIRRYRMFTGRVDQIDPSTEALVIRIGQPFSNHNAGWIGFAGDGTLLIPTGDGGGANDPLGVAQDPNSLLGKVLRLDVSRDAFPGDPARNYAIPADNPFSSGAGGSPEIFALGLRNPYRASYDPVDDALYIADVGQNAREEVSRMDLSDPGANFGWPILEGLRRNQDGDASGFTPPIAEYRHGVNDGEGRSITGGALVRLEFEAEGTPDEAYYLFGDFISGNVWTLDLQKLPASGTVDAETFAALAPDGAVQLIGNYPQITDVSATRDGAIIISTLGGTVVQGRSSD